VDPSIKKNQSVLFWQTAELNKQLEALPDELLEKARIICDEAAIQSERASLRSGVAASVEDTSIGSVFVAPRVTGSMCCHPISFCVLWKTQLATIAQMQSEGTN
jgi:hypothetical protein